MPEFFQQLNQLVLQINTLLQQLTDEQYSQPLAIFHQHSIGEHTRHKIEFFEALVQGYEEGFVNYDKRKRNKIYETDKTAALLALEKIVLACNKPDKLLQLHVSLDSTQGSGNTISTTYFRELVFAIDHSVHHMALIRIGVEQFTNIIVPHNFGVAASTQQHQALCAQ